MEVNDFVSILYATLVRFYLPSVHINDLELMTQDLIEIATSMTIDGSLSNWLIKLCRLTLSEEEQLLATKLNVFKDIEPEQLGINSMFTMNQSSRLLCMVKQNTASIINEKSNIRFASFNCEHLRLTAKKACDNEVSDFDQAMQVPNLDMSGEIERRYSDDIDKNSPDKS